MEGYQTIRLRGELESTRHRKGHVLSVPLVFVGAMIATLGISWAAKASGGLYSATGTAIVTKNGLQKFTEPVKQLPNNPATLNLASSVDRGSGFNYVQVGHTGQWSLVRQASAVFVSAVLGAAASWAFHKSTSPWTMAAVEEKPEVLDDDNEDDDELLPTLDELLAARQEFLRLQGKGPGAQLAPGEILRPVHFPGEKEPVDLVEMYKRFEELLGDNIRYPVVGTRVTGTVFDTDDRGASIDYGGKTIGFCPMEELALCKVKRATDVVEVGDKREFQILASPKSRRRDDDDFTLLSLKTIAEEVAWKRLQQYRENDITFSVVLKGKNRGGYMMEVQDLAIPGFLPKSQAMSDLATAPENVDPTLFMDQVVEVKVLDLDPERKRLVVSQRAANPKMATDTFKMGTVHEGIVQNVKPYGVFVDVNGMSGLLHISQISNSRIENVEAIFKVGDKIKCMVLSQDPVQGRLALSTKRLEPTHGDMLTNQQLVYEKAEEMAERFRADIAAAEKRMQEFEAKLAEQNTVALN